MQESKQTTRNIPPIVKYAFALALGIGVELVAEALKFLAGAGVRELDDLEHGRVGLDGIFFLVIIVAVLSAVSVLVINFMEHCLNTKSQRSVLIASILIVGIVLEIHEENRYQKEFERTARSPSNMKSRNK